MASHAVTVSASKKRSSDQVGVVDLARGGGSRVGGTFSTPVQGTVNGFVTMDKYNKLMKRNTLLMGAMASMEQNVASMGKKGRSNRDKKGWTPVEYTNDNMIRKYCRDKIWPHYCRLGVGWSRYSENPRSLCVQIMGMVEIEEGKH